jgi:hypothetical protein
MPAGGSDDLIIIPVHRPKTNWLVSFLNSVALQGPDTQKLVLVTSNKDDAVYFGQALAYHPLADRIKFLDAEAYGWATFGSQQLVDRLRRNADNSIVNLKKFLGLHWALQSGADYCICLDCDVIALTTLSRVLEIGRDNYQERLYLGAGVEGFADSQRFRQVMQESASLFGPDQQKAIREVTENFSLYTWFTDFPVYRKDDLNGFFAAMSEVHGSFPDFLCALRWASFDHMLYMLHRVSRGDARIFDYRKSLNIDTAPENLRPQELLRIGLESGYEAGWISAKSAFDHPEAFRILPNLCLLMHFDR